MAIFSPLLLHAVAMGYILIPVFQPKIDLHVAVSISAVVALAAAFAFYRIALKNARVLTQG